MTETNTGQTLAENHSLDKKIEDKPHLPVLEWIDLGMSDTQRIRARQYHESDRKLWQRHMPTKLIAAGPETTNSGQYAITGDKTFVNSGKYIVSDRVLIRVGYKSTDEMKRTILYDIKASTSAGATIITRSHKIRASGDNEKKLGTYLRSLGYVSDNSGEVWVPEGRSEEVTGVRQYQQVSLEPNNSVLTSLDRLSLKYSAFTEPHKNSSLRELYESLMNNDLRASFGVGLIALLKSKHYWNEYHRLKVIDNSVDVSKVACSNAVEHEKVWEYAAMVIEESMIPNELKKIRITISNGDAVFNSHVENFHNPPLDNPAIVRSSLISATKRFLNSHKFVVITSEEGVYKLAKNDGFLHFDRKSNSIIAKILVENGYVYDTAYLDHKAERSSGIMGGIPGFTGVLFHRKESVIEKMAEYIMSIAST